MKIIKTQLTNAEFNDMVGALIYRAKLLDADHYPTRAARLRKLRKKLNSAWHEGERENRVTVRLWRRDLEKLRADIVAHTPNLSPKIRRILSSMGAPLGPRE